MMKPKDIDSPTVNKLPLPELWGGTDPREWKQQAERAAPQISETVYGGLPPAPENLRVEKCCEARVARWPGAPKLWSYKVHVEGGGKPFSFCVRILYPEGEGPFPAIINGDGCWWYATEEIAKMVLAQGCALVMFNRTEMARDWGGETHGDPDWKLREGGLYELYPEASFGAISAWAWGIHRCVDLLMSLAFIDQEKIAVSGHSRGGKSALLAGLMDHRISLINDNAAGAGGSALSRYVTGGGEGLEKILAEFPHWFGPELQKFIGKEEMLPFDQHTLLACLAPRPVLFTYALGDLWSNPPGMVLAVEAARKVYHLYGKAEGLAFHLREGAHAHLPEDWAVLLDFIGIHWQGKASGTTYNQHPFPLPQ